MGIQKKSSKSFHLYLNPHIYFGFLEVHPGILKNIHYFIVFIYTKIQHYFVTLFFHSFSCLLSS